MRTAACLARSAFGAYQYSRGLSPATPTSVRNTLRNISGTPCTGVRCTHHPPTPAQDRTDMAAGTPSWTAVLAAAACLTSGSAGADGPARNDYPTYARVQYVQDCAARAGGSQADVYKCSCVI